jgi:hypothetical protein
MRAGLGVIADNLIPIGTLGVHRRFCGVSGSDNPPTLLPGGSLEVKWEANEMGNELGLVSGTATLVRKVE